MSFFGGGTDMPAFFNEHGGAVISTTFDKYCYVNVRHMPPFHPYISELVYSRFERVNDIDNIEHPLIRECMRLHDIHEIRLTYEGDLPAMAEVTINVGTKYAGKTLYYSQVFDDHVVQVQRVVVDAKGDIAISQDHCSDYVVTTESIVGSDISSDEDDIAAIFEKLKL